MSCVFIHNATHLHECLASCWEALAARNVSPIKSVLLKPNFVNDMSSEKGVTTSFSVIDQVLEFLEEKNIRTIAIAEASIQDTEEVFDHLGVYAAYGKRARIINLEHVPRTTVSSPLGLSIQSFSIPACIQEYDLIINIPKMKTHVLTGVSLGMKNLFAFFSRPARKFAHVTDIDLAIVDMYACLSSRMPIITVMDATVAMSGPRGPIHGKAITTGIVLGGCDTVAVDAAAVAIMGGDYSRIMHIDSAIRHNLGSKPEIRNTDAVPCDDIRHGFVVPEPAQSTKARLVALKNAVFKKRPKLMRPENCVRCLACVAICPKNCIASANNTIVVDYTDCVSCLCCCEACKYDAMGYTVRCNTLYTLMVSLKKMTGKPTR